jgi:branched-subunit amino acid transport protein AzlD
MYLQGHILHKWCHHDRKQFLKFPEICFNVTILLCLTSSTCSRILPFWVCSVWKSLRVKSENAVTQLSMQNRVILSLLILHWVLVYCFSKQKIWWKVWLSPVKAYVRSQQVTALCSISKCVTQNLKTNFLLSIFMTNIQTDINRDNHTTKQNANTINSFLLITQWMIGHRNVWRWLIMSME